MDATTAFRGTFALAFAAALCLSAAAQNPSGRNSGLRPASFDAPAAEELPQATPVFTTDGASSPYHLSLAEAKSRTLQNSAIMDLASAQIAAKCHTLQAARKDYLPKLLNSFAYFHFDSDLGTVVKTPGILFPSQAVSVPVFEQDSTMYTAAAIQPITPLLKIREVVNISAADVGAAQAQRNEARRELTKGVEQLYLGLLATQRIKAGLEQAVGGAQQMAAALKSPDARISLVQAQQGLLGAEGQLADLTVQMNALVALPPQTRLELEEPPPPAKPFSSVDEADAAAVASSPTVEQARSQVLKAEAALRIAEADYVPNVMAYGLYQSQSATPIIQHDFTGVGVSATYVLEWGKKNDTYRASQATVCLARQNLRKEIEDTRLKAAKTFGTVEQSEQALDYAKQLAELNRQVQPPANDLAALKSTAQARLEAEVALIKAQLAYQTAIVELRSMIGQAD